MELFEKRVGNFLKNISGKYVFTTSQQYSILKNCYGKIKLDYDDCKNNSLLQLHCHIKTFYKFKIHNRKKIS